MNRISGFMNEEEYDPIAELVAIYTDRILEAEFAPDEIGEIIYELYMNTVEDVRKQTLKSIVTSLTEAI